MIYEKKDAYNYLKATTILAKYQKMDDQTYSHMMKAITLTLERIDNLEKENQKLIEKIKKLKRNRNAKTN